MEKEALGARRLGVDFRISKIVAIAGGLPTLAVFSWGYERTFRKGVDELNREGKVWTYFA